MSSNGAVTLGQAYQATQTNRSRSNRQTFIRIETQKGDGKRKAKPSKLAISFSKVSAKSFAKRLRRQKSWLTQGHDAFTFRTTSTTEVAFIRYLCTSRLKEMTSRKLSWNLTRVKSSARGRRLAGNPRGQLHG
jgi:hypothetical protein